MSVTFNRHGIRILYLGHLMGEFQVHPKMAALLDATLADLAEHGCVEIHTLGFINDRPIRGRENAVPIGAICHWAGTSKHSTGRIKRTGKNKFRCVAPWPDGEKGTKAADIVGAVWDDGRTMSVSVPGERKLMIAFCERHGWTVFHKKPLRTGDHIHIEVP